MTDLEENLTTTHGYKQTKHSEFKEKQSGNKELNALYELKHSMNEDELVDEISRKIRDFNNLTAKEQEDLKDFFQPRYNILQRNNQNNIYKETLNQGQVDLAMLLVKNWTVNLKEQNCDNQTLIDIVYSKKDEELQKQLSELWVKKFRILDNPINFHNTQLQKKRQMDKISLLSKIVGWFKKKFYFQAN